MAMPSADLIADAVFLTLGGNLRSYREILGNHRGSPRAADLRAVCWRVWRELQDNQPTYQQTAKAWGRDRTAIARGLKRIELKGAITEGDLEQIKRLLSAPKVAN